MGQKVGGKKCLSYIIHKTIIQMQIESQITLG